MPSISESLAQAVAYHRAGQFQQAEHIYRQVLQADPRNADAWHLLGVIGSQFNQHEVAIEYIRRAIELNPNSTAFHANLGAAYQKLNRFDEAVSCYRRALELNPNNAEAHNHLGVAFQSLGDLATAEACFRRALTHNAYYPDAHSNLGNVLQAVGKPAEALASQQRAAQLKPGYAEAHRGIGAALKGLGSLDGAIAAYRRALELNPKAPETYNNLGNALKDQGKLDEAIACWRRALDLTPNDADAHNNLGMVFTEQRKLDDAVACYRRAVELKPEFAEAHNNLGSTLQDLGKLDDAVACYRRALELKPGLAVAHAGLGNAWKHQEKLDEAIASCRRALELKPDLAEAHNTLGNALKDQGKPDEAVACYRRALECKPDYAMAHDNLVLALHYCPGVTLAALAEAHAEYDRRQASPLRGAVAARENVRNRNGRLRLGFVSPDLSRHPVGWFLLGVLENLNQEQQETICYSDGMVKDDLTNRLRAAATQWRDVNQLGDQRLADQIRTDRIDILFDLAGHTAHNRLLVFARKPAPIQVTWAGYVGTTGLTAMDYLLADRYEVPPGTERYYQERVLRMPDGYVCYDPPSYAPAVMPLSALECGQVTFGSFNNPAKITSQAIEVWARILRRLPEARLVLKFKGWNNNGLARRFGEMFANQGIDPRRLELLGPSPHDKFLAEYNRIDLALDTFPYSGGLTTCEALWMGVPVITCPGETFASRHSLSHLSNVGLTETVAQDFDGYVELAVSLAGDLPRLAALRAGLRERMAASPLCDGKRFAVNFASVLHDVWQQGVE
ncbi:MAG: tetratricopeptide repeat protein [Thermoguttaceae bacterium]